MKHMLLLGLLCSFAASPAVAGPPENRATVDPATFRQSIANVRFDAPATADARTLPPAAVQNGKKMSTGWRVLWTAAAGFGGFYAGGVIGSRIEGDCNGCDDPGLRGAIIGAPIGAAAAAITTWILSGR